MKEQDRNIGKDGHGEAVEVVGLEVVASEDAAALSDIKRHITHALPEPTYSMLLRRIEAAERRAEAAECAVTELSATLSAQRGDATEAVDGDEEEDTDGMDNLYSYTVREMLFPRSASVAVCSAAWLCLLLLGQVIFAFGFHDASWLLVFLGELCSVEVSLYCVHVLLPQVSCLRLLTRSSSRVSTMRAHAWGSETTKSHLTFLPLS